MNHRTKKNFDVLKELLRSTEQWHHPSFLESGLVPQDAFENCIMRMQSNWRGMASCRYSVLQVLRRSCLSIPEATGQFLWSAFAAKAFFFLGGGGGNRGGNFLRGADQPALT